jgi:hypothetical protein
MEYTVEVYQADRRFKSGEVMVNKQDLEFATLEEAQAWGPNRYAKDYGRSYRFEVHETWITRKNLMSGMPVKERYDQPYHCSVASESYWSS